MQPTILSGIGMVFLFVFLLIFIWLLFKGSNEFERLKNERERIKNMPKYRREGRLLIRRENSDGSYEDLSYELIDVGDGSPGVYRLAEGKHKQLLGQTRNGRKNGKDVELYRGNYPSHLMKSNRHEEE